MTAELIEDVTLRMPSPRGLTWADLQDVPDDGHRYGTSDGSLHGSAAQTPWHRVAAGEVVALLRGSLPDDLLVVDTVAVDVGSVLEPDVLDVRGSAVTARTRRAGLVGPRGRG